MKEWRTNIKRFLKTAIISGLVLASGLAGTALSSWAAPSGDVGIRTHIINPPNAITGFAAAPVGTTNGDIQLAWIAPANLNSIAIGHYFIRYATFPAANVGDAENWWINAAATQFQFAPAAAPGVQEFTIQGGFTLGTRFYFGIKSVDLDGSISPIDDRVGLPNQANSIPLVITTGPPDTPTNFAGTALSTSSIQWTWDNDVEASFYALNEFPSGVMVLQTTHTFAVENTFTPNMAVSRTLQAANGFGLSNHTSVQTVYTLALAPTNLVLTNVGFTEISMSWDGGNNASGTQYRLERSLDGINFVPLTTITLSSYTDTGLAELTSYSYRVRATNGDGISTAYSNIITTSTPQQVDFLAPHEPLGLKGALDPTGRAFTLIWDPVTTNADKTPISDLQGYNIYRRTTLLGTGTKITPTPITVTAFADQVDGQVFYYTVTAIDTSGNESDSSLVADSSSLENIIYLSTDELSSVVMPSSVSNLLRKDHNELGVGLDIVLEEQTVPQGTNVVRSIRFRLLRGDNNEDANLAFQLPNTVVAVGYNSINGQIAIGEPTLASQSSSVPAQIVNASPRDLAFYWHNGVTWVKVGGTLDEAAQTLKTKTSFLGNYQIRVAGQATSLSLEESNVYPRVFTPNGDGLNDRVYFVLENPNNTDVTAEILDLKGRPIKTLDQPSTQMGIGYTFSWDGTDQNGATVPSGAYMYRIKGEGKTITGTIAVAR